MDYTDLPARSLRTPPPLCAPTINQPVSNRPLIQGFSWMTRFLPVAPDLLEWLEHKVDMLNGYRHHGDQRFLTDIKAGQFDTVRLLSNPSMIDRIMWMWQHIRVSLFAPVQSHGMAIYRDKLEYLVNTETGNPCKPAPPPRRRELRQSPPRGRCAST